MLQVAVGSSDKFTECFDSLWCVKVVGKALMNCGLHSREDLIEIVVTLHPLLLCVLYIALSEVCLDILKEF